MNDIFKILYNIIWGPQLLLGLIFLGLYLTYKIRFYQIRYLKSAFIELIKQRHQKANFGEINGYQALMTALSSTVGTGNIGGVAVAISTGGAGAVFWMWVIGFVGMASKFVESTLSVAYNEKDDLGYNVGGPMYYITKAMGNNWAYMGLFYAVMICIAGFFAGNVVQVYAILQTLSDFTVNITGVIEWRDTSKIIFAIIIFILTFFILVGGIKRIAEFAESIVPIMIILYVSSALIVIGLHITQIPSLLWQIIYEAFVPQAAVGGILGYSFLKSMQTGMARAIFSSESGIGSAGIAQAATHTNDPIKQGTIAMLGTFIDTIIVCTMTAIVILIAGNYFDTEYTDVLLASAAFSKTLPFIGDYVIPVCLPLFAFTSLIGWSYYSEKGIEYALGTKSIMPFRITWSLMVFYGAYLSITNEKETIWLLSDIAFGLIIYPNMIALFYLAPKVQAMLRDYLAARGEKL
jgi:AGCS family alanine or glycine:cation symporter